MPFKSTTFSSMVDDSLALSRYSMYLVGVNFAVNEAPQAIDAAANPTPCRLF